MQKTPPTTRSGSSPFAFLACFPLAFPRQRKSRLEALASGPQVNREVIPDPLIQEVVHPLEQRPVLSAQRNKKGKNNKRGGGGGGARPILTTEAAHRNNNKNNKVRRGRRTAGFDEKRGGGGGGASKYQNARMRNPRAASSVATLSSHSISLRNAFERKIKPNLK